MTPYFFGFGSLVNSATHTYGETRPARLHGWRRRWVATTLRDIAFLSVEPAEQGQIDGLLAAVPGGDWQALDLREFAYERVACADQISASGDTPPEADTRAWPSDVSLYRVPDAHKHPQAQPGVLLSYLDVVLQGYLRVFGPEGVEAFFATTDGWDLPLIDDRTAPRYPRHQPISASEKALFDPLIAASGARVTR